MNEENAVPKRPYYYSKNVAKPKASADSYEQTVLDAACDLVDKPEKANLIGSRCEDGTHAPVIDFDIPIEVYPSSRLGHHHLYINKKITWPQYKAILTSLSNAGLIEPGYLKASVSLEQSFVRPVGVVKIDAPQGAKVLRENALLRQENYRLRQQLAKLQADATA